MFQSRRDKYQSNNILRLILAFDQLNAQIRLL
jgi:hypothetical protein